MTTVAPKARNEGKDRPMRGANGADEGRGLRLLTGVLLLLTPVAMKRSGIAAGELGR